MSQPIHFSPAALRRRWLLWAVYLISWTTALVVPVPGGAFLEVEVFQVTRKFLIAKSLHILAYAGLAILSGRLLIAARFRWAMMFFLMFHGCATEMIQLYLSYRSGLLMDVMFDNIGIALGVAVSWKYWTAPDRLIATKTGTPEEEEECTPVRQ
jgi:VanZ family protein